MRLRWDAAPWLLVPLPLLAAPAASLWIAAALLATGLGNPLVARIGLLERFTGLSIRAPVVVDDDITLDIHYRGWRRSFPRGAQAIREDGIETSGLDV